MKQLEGFREQVSTHQCRNGLQVLIYHKPKASSTFAVMATGFGAFSLSEADKFDNMYHFHSGAAHFLEHKLFEEDSEDMLSYFAALGANVNAFTSYTHTAYYFQTSENPDQALEKLMDFVQHLSITDASVEKEKGIIIQELRMYDEMPDYRLYHETMKSLYVNHPLNCDIGGSEADVLAITRDELETAYRLNYHPASMVLVVVSPQQPDHLIQLIEKNQSSKQFAPSDEVYRLIVDEPVLPARNTYEFQMRSERRKYTLAYKLRPVQETQEGLIKKEQALRFAMELLYSPLNSNYQKWLDEGLINDYFSVECELDIDFGYVMFYNETTDPEKFRDMIERTLNDTIVQEHRLTQLKHRVLGSQIRTLERYEALAISSARLALLGLSYFDYVSIVQSVDIEDVRSAIYMLLDAHAVTVMLNPEE